MPERNPNPAAPARAAAAPRGEPMSELDRTGRQPKGHLVLRTLAMPRDTNPSGDIFGGWILAQMDVAGGLMAFVGAELRQGIDVVLDAVDF